MRNMTIYEGDVIDSVVRTSGPDEPVNGVTPCWTSDKECGVDEGDVVLTWTGSDEPVNSVVCTSGLFAHPGRMNRSVV